MDYLCIAGILDAITREIRYDDVLMWKKFDMGCSMFHLRVWNIKTGDHNRTSSLFHYNHYINF